MIPALHAFALAVSSSLPASIVTKATVIAALGLTGARLARRQRAAARHVLLAATFGVLLLLPVASSIAPPVRITVRTEAQRRAELPSLPGAIEVVLARTLPDTHAAVTPAMPWSSRPSLTALLLAGWLVGVTLSLTPVIVL